MKRKLYAECVDRRDKLQIFADIIKVSTAESKITRILRLANVQYNTFNEYTETLCRAGLLERIMSYKKPRKSRDLHKTFAFKATERGLKWIEMVDSIYQVIEEPTEDAREYIFNMTTIHNA